MIGYNDLSYIGLQRTANSPHGNQHATTDSAPLVFLSAAASSHLLPQEAAARERAMQVYLSALIVIGSFVVFYTFIYVVTHLMACIYNIDDDDAANDLNAPLVDGYELP